MDGFVPCCLDVEPGVSCLLYGRMTVNPVGKKTLDAKRRKQQQQQQERRPPFLFFSLFLCPLARDCRFTYVNQPVKRLNVFTPSLGCLSYHRATSTYSPRLTIDSQTWLHTVRYGSGSTKPSRTQYLPVRVSPPLFLALFSHRRFFFPTVQDSFLLRLNEHFIVIILSALREWEGTVSIRISMCRRGVDQRQNLICAYYYMNIFNFFSNSLLFFFFFYPLNSFCSSIILGFMNIFTLRLWYLSFFSWKKNQTAFFHPFIHSIHPLYCSELFGCGIQWHLLTWRGSRWSSISKTLGRAMNR